MKKIIRKIILVIIGIIIVFIAVNFVRDKVIVNNSYKIGEGSIKIPVFGIEMFNK